MSYQINGKQILYVENGNSVHIADVANTEAALFLAVASNEFCITGNYIADAVTTLSVAWHGDKVSKAQFVGRINGAIDALNKLDQVKKSLFYGKDNNLISEGQKDVSDLPDRMVMPIGAVARNVIHAIIGKATEAGELLEALRDCYNGDVFDRINAIEEVGDGFWYDAILLDEMGASFSEAMRRNINKLKARFPDKFSSDNALVRNLEAERAILEDRDNPIALEPTLPVGGPDAVLNAEVKAGEAFDIVKNKQLNASSIEAGSVMSVTGDMSKSIGDRQQLMPGEEISHQPIRPKDAKK